MYFLGDHVLIDRTKKKKSKDKRRKITKEEEEEETDPRWAALKGLSSDGDQEEKD